MFQITRCKIISSILITLDSGVGFPTYLWQTCLFDGGRRDERYRKEKREERVKDSFGNMRNKKHN